MATLKQVRDKADAKLVQFWQMLTEKQAAYFAKRGKYFQLLVSGGRSVENGEEYPFSPVSPPDEKYTIDIDTAWSDVLPFEIFVSEWVGPDNDIGYVAVVRVDFQGNTYTRSRDHLNNDTGWGILTEPI